MIDVWAFGWTIFNILAPQWYFSFYDTIVPSSVSENKYTGVCTRVRAVRAPSRVVWAVLACSILPSWIEVFFFRCWDWYDFCRRSSSAGHLLAAREQFVYSFVELHHCRGWRIGPRDQWHSLGGCEYMYIKIMLYNNYMVHQGHTYSNSEWITYLRSSLLMYKSIF